MELGLLMFLLSTRTAGLCVCFLILSGSGLVLPRSTQTVPGQVAPNESAPSIPSKPPSSSAPEAQTPVPTNPIPITFESRGLEYEALTKEGITVMCASLPPRIKDFSAMQVTVTNGSLVPWTVKPSDFSFAKSDGSILQAVSADDVVESLLEKASRNDVIKLQLLYEDSIYALANYRPTNGYERRREAAMAQFVNPRFKAAAAASAITFSPVKLKPGDSTDGAIFFELHSKEKSLGRGRLIARTCGETFTFQVEPELKLRQ